MAGVRSVSAAKLPTRHGGRVERMRGIMSTGRDADALRLTPYRS
jgi:hypothetical protein